MRYRAPRNPERRELRREGAVDIEFYEYARNRYDRGEAADYHRELGEGMTANGWSDYDIARTHLDIAEAITNRQTIEASWSAGGIEP
jgi:hypothetical protein